MSKQQPQQQRTTTSIELHQTQQQHLDDTDIYASVWHDAVAQSLEQSGDVSKVIGAKWGGRGQGGRGVARRTVQTNDISIPDGVRLEYVGVNRSHRRSQDSSSSAPFLLLENARLSLLSGHTYGMIGPNGCGKTSLLRRIDSCKIPGFPIHVTTLLIQPHFLPATTDESTSLSTLQYLIHRYHVYCTDHVQAVNHSHIQQLEDAIEQLDLKDGAHENENETTLNEYMEAIACFEETIADSESMTNDDNAKLLSNAAVVSLEFMGLPNELHDLPFHGLTTGQQSKVLLALILLCCTISYCDLLLIDEITSTLDIFGLIHLRRIINMITSPNSNNFDDNDLPFVQSYFTNPNRKPTTIVLVSHDNDFLNDIATDIIEFHTIEKKLYYYRGNYNQFLVQRQQKDQAQVHQVETLQKKEVMMQQVLNNIRSQPVHTSRGAKKKAKTINCHKKKMDKVLYNNEASFAPDSETIRSILRRKKYEDEPDKRVQFSFRNCTNKWNEPIIVAMDVGHTFHKKEEILSTASSKNEQVLSAQQSPDQLFITCKDGYLFDNIDLGIAEGGVYCIMGESGCGKSTFLKILSNQIFPTEGTVHHASSSNVAYIDFSTSHGTYSIEQSDRNMTTLQYLMKKHPTKTEHEIRSELSSFGLGTKQGQTVISFLSGGEQCRLIMTHTMLQYTYLDVLCLDNPTANLDVESVDALIYGLKKWNGTIIMSCHDSYFVRSFEQAKCYVLTGKNEGKLRFVKGGMEEYIRSFGQK